MCSGQDSVWAHSTSSCTYKKTVPANCHLTLHIAKPYTALDVPTSFTADGIITTDSTVICNVDFAEAAGDTTWGGVAVNDHFAAEITGYINIAKAGSWTFYTKSDDGSRIFIDETLVVEKTGIAGFTEESGVIRLGAGKHAFRATYFENTGTAGFQASWEGPYSSTVTTKEIIPESAFSSTGPIINATYPVRLMDGVDASEGRLEVYYNGVWGTVCDDYFDQVAGDIACKQLGYGYASTIGTVEYTKRGAGEIWLDDLMCNGTERGISGCDNPGWGLNNCGHWEDTWLKCSDTKLSLNGQSGSEGLLEVYHNGQWGSVCDDGFDRTNADVVCSQLGLGSSVWTGTAIYANQGTGPIWLDEVSCQGTEAKIQDCPNDGWGVQNCGHYEDVSIVCSGGGMAQSSAPLRLNMTDAPTTGVANQGRLEIFWEGEWGAVCDDAFGMAEGSIACEQLGLGNATAITSAGNEWPHIAGQKTWLDDVSCTGTETALSQCGRRPFGSHNCATTHTEDLILTCAGTGGPTPPPAPPSTCALTMKISTGYQTTLTPKSFAESSLTPTDTTTTCDINFAAQSGDVVWAGVAVHNHFAAEITGYLTILAEGVYTFYLSSDDGSRLYIDGQQVIDNAGIHGMGEMSGTISLTATKHSIRVMFYENTGEAGLILSYEGATSQRRRSGVSKQVIPESAFSSTPPCRLHMKISENYNDETTPNSFTEAGLIASQEADICDVNFPLQTGETIWGGITVHNHFAAEITGNLEITTAGQYTFYSESDDGSLVFVNDWRVVNDEGIHGMTEANGVQTLGVGSHTLRIMYFEKTGGAGLIVSYSGPGIDKQVIPASAFTDTAPSNSTTHPIRLADGATDMEGRLEINYNGEWGTVCNDHFTQVDADVVCKQLGHGYAKKFSTNNWWGSSAQGTGPIWMDEVKCVGTEDALSQCPFAGWGVNDCHHYEDIKVECSDVRLTGDVEEETEGRLEVYHDRQWGTVCDDGFTMSEANVVCAQLGLGPAKWQGTVVRSTEGTGPIWMNNVACDGTESKITECTYTGWGVQNCVHGEDVEMVCSPSTANTNQPYPMRLVAPGIHPTPVFIELVNKHCSDSTSKTVFTDLAKAQEVCGQAQSCTGVYARYGTTWLLCTEEESNWTWSFVSKVYKKVSTGTEILEGRLEIYYDDQWGTVCDDGFDMDEATVVCNQMGLGNATTLGTVESTNQGTGKIWLDDVSCNGGETMLSQCSHRPFGSNNCAHGEDTKVTCTGSSSGGGGGSGTIPPTPVPTPIPTRVPTMPAGPGATPAPTPAPTVNTDGLVSFVALLDGVSTSEFQSLPTCTATGYTPLVLTDWNAGDAAWIDRPYTFTDFGEFTTMMYDFKVQTSVNSRTSEYTIAPATRSTVVVIADSAMNAPLLDSTNGWSDCVEQMVNGGYLHYEVRGIEYPMTWCKQTEIDRGSTLTIDESTGAKTDIFIRHHNPTEHELYNQAVAEWAGEACHQPGFETLPEMCDSSDVKSEAIDSAAHTISITTHVYAGGNAAALKAIQDMNTAGIAELQRNIRAKGVSSGIDGLSSARLTLTTKPVLGEIQPSEAAKYVISAVSLFGIDKSHFDDTAQGGFKQVIGYHAGSNCGHGTMSCHAGDVQIMSISGLTIRRDVGILVKFVLTTASAELAQESASMLSAYMNSPSFREALVQQGGELAGVTSTAMSMPPTATVFGDDPSTPSSGGKDKKGGKGALVAVLSITTGLALCGCVIAGMYILMNRRPGGSLADHDQNAVAFPAYGDDEYDQGSYPIPVAEVVGVSEPSWSQLRTDDAPAVDPAAIMMQDMPPMRAKDTDRPARPPSYDDDESEDAGMLK